MRQWFLGWVRAVGLWLVRWSTPTASDPVLEAVLESCRHAGVAMDTVHADADLSRSGKVPEILYHAAKGLGSGHALQTVQAMAKALRGTA